jgi:hypothetical protein
MVARPAVRGHLPAALCSLPLGGSKLQSELARGG